MVVPECPRRGESFFFPSRSGRLGKEGIVPHSVVGPQWLLVYSFVRVRARPRYRTTFETLFTMWTLRFTKLPELPKPEQFHHVSAYKFNTQKLPFFVRKLLACFVSSTCVHGKYRICALYADANSLSLVFDVVRLLTSSTWSMILRPQPGRAPRWMVRQPMLPEQSNTPCRAGGAECLA